MFKFSKAIGFVIMLAILVGGVYGYVANVYSLVTHNEAIGMTIGRAVGIFLAPLGIILGYF